MRDERDVVLDIQVCECLAVLSDTDRRVAVFHFWKNRIYGEMYLHMGRHAVPLS